MSTKQWERLLQSLLVKGTDAFAQEFTSDSRIVDPLSIQQVAHIVRHLLQFPFALLNGVEAMMQEPFASKVSGQDWFKIALVLSRNQANGVLGQLASKSRIMHRMPLEERRELYQYVVFKKGAQGVMKPLDLVKTVPGMMTTWMGLGDDHLKSPTPRAAQGFRSLLKRPPALPKPRLGKVSSTVVKSIRL